MRSLNVGWSLKNLSARLTADGLAFIGLRRAGPDVMRRWRNEMGKYFHHIFIFGACGEVVRAEYLPRVDFLIVIGVGPK